MELGNLLFGHSRGEYVFPDRNLVNCREWNTLLEVARLDFYGVSDDGNYGFDNDTFTIRPYYWGEDEEEADKPNFLYKPTGFEIRWYKYPFRDSYMNQNLTNKEIKKIFRNCIVSIQNKRED